MMVRKLRLKSCMVNLATPASLTKRLTILVKPDIWPPVFGDGKT